MKAARAPRALKRRRVRLPARESRERASLIGDLQLNGLSIAEIAACLDVDRTTVTYHLNKKRARP